MNNRRSYIIDTRILFAGMIRSQIRCGVSLAGVIGSPISYLNLKDVIIISHVNHAGVIRSLIKRKGCDPQAWCQPRRSDTIPNLSEWVTSFLTSVRNELVNVTSSVFLPLSRVGLLRTLRATEYSA